jgi:DNA-binding transcriptional LysR family regulator
LLGPAADAIAQLERVFAPPQPFLPRTSRRVFRIAATDNLELYVLPRLASILATEAPHVDLRFHHLPKDWAAALARGAFELKLGRKYRLTPPLRGEDLARDHLVCVVRRGHRAPRRLTLRQYASLSHILVAPGETERGFMDEVLARHGLQRRVAITVPHFLVALFAVAASDHALAIPARLIEVIAPALRLRTIPLPARPAEYVLSQVWAGRHEADEGHRWLREVVRRAFKK